MHDDLRRLDELSRRKFVQYSAKALLGVGLASVTPTGTAWGSLTTAAPRPRARNVIYIYLGGGMSHLDTFDPKPQAPDTDAPIPAIGTNVDGIQVSELLPGLAQRMNHVALIRSMFTTQGAHEDGNYYVHTSYVRRGTIQHPGLGAWLMRMSGRTNSTLPGNIRIGGSAQTPGREGFLAPKFAPLHIGDPTKGLSHARLHERVDEEELQERLALKEMMDMSFHRQYASVQVDSHHEMYREALKLMTSEDLQAFDLSQESDTDRLRYGENRFGNGCLLARRLVEHGVRYIEVNQGGWDTHNDNRPNVERLTGELDQALSALLDDLHWRGLLEETLVVTTTEFGRTPRLNQNAGRDHHPQAFSYLMAGGGVRGGQVHGATDPRGAAVAENGVRVPDFNATIAYALGLPVDQVITSPSGRPFTIADKGEPLHRLF